MAEQSGLPFGMGGQLGGGVADLVSTVKGGVQNLSEINQTLNGLADSTAILAAINTTLIAAYTALLAINTAILTTFPRINGTFTLSAATTTNVAEVRLAANAIVIPFATNATAALIVRTNGLFHSASTSGVGFTVSTQSGSATSGGTFEYIAFNPS